MKVKKLAKKMKKLDSKIVSCKKCPFDRGGECTLQSMCITGHKDLATLEKFFKKRGRK